MDTTGPGGPLTPERWQRVKDLAHKVLELGPHERAACLDQADRDDPELVREVRSLLAAHDQADGFIETPALARTDMASVLGNLQGASNWVGRRVGPYVLVREIGHGGMGAVYLAARADDEYRKQVAIKVVRSNLDPGFIQHRFRHERQILADLDHPNIARLIDAGSTEDGAPYFVMEYVDGLPIDQHCQSQRLSVGARLTLFLQVCAAVHYAHQHLVIHRDLKASNILVTADGVPKLLDFGIAKLLDSQSPPREEQTLTVMRVMTIESASPEQVLGQRVTTTSDVYALGVLLHRLLTGRGPYAEATTRTPHDLARAICEVDPLRPSDVAADAQVARRLKGDLDTIVLKALQKEPGRRYGAVDQLADDISRHLAGRPVLAQPDTIRYRATKFVTRHKALVAAAALLVVSLIGGTIATAWQAHVAGVQQLRAERRFNDVRRLANSFLFEFHDAIQGLPGSTKARELVVRRATEYLDSLSTESGNDPSLERELAAAYEKFGDVQGLAESANLGDTAGALRSHQKALALRQNLLQSNPADMSLQTELAITHDHLGRIMDQLNDSKAALEHARKALALREAIVARNPTGVAERSNLATSYTNMSSVMSVMKEWGPALDNAQRAARAFEELLVLDPSNQRAQRNAGIAYKYLGGQLERNGDRDGAVLNYRKAIALDEVRARANRHDAQAQLDLSFGYASIGYALSQMGNFADSLDNYQRALELREEVAAADPNDANAIRVVVRGHLSIGNVLRKAGRWHEAIDHYEKVREIAGQKLAADASNTWARSQLTNVYGVMAGATSEMAAATKDATQATRRWREAREWSQKALAGWSAQAAARALSSDDQAEVDLLKQMVSKSDAALGAIEPPRSASRR